MCIIRIIVYTLKIIKPAVSKTIISIATIASWHVAII